MSDIKLGPQQTINDRIDLVQIVCIIVNGRTYEASHITREAISVQRRPI